MRPNGAIIASMGLHPRPDEVAPAPGIDLFWIPLGAGGNGFVRMNGRLYEAVQARRRRRSRLDVYHTALEVIVPEGRFIIENAWPSPDRETSGRGVVLEGPVFSRRLARLRAFRYEVRRWRDGVVPDIHHAVASPHRVSDDTAAAAMLLDLVGQVPPYVWGRDELAAGEMWNSNSVIAWLLQRSGLPAHEIEPPPGGSVPGWGAGVAAALRP